MKKQVNTYLLWILVLSVGVVSGLTSAAIAQDGFVSKTDVMLDTINNLIEAKEYEQAEVIATELTDTQPGLVDGWMMLAYTRTLTEKYEASNAAYDHALQLGATPKEVYTRKAYNCRRLGDAQLTRECYEAILAGEPDNVELKLQLAAFEAQVSDFERSRALYEEVLAADPSNAQAIEALAHVASKLGDDSAVDMWLRRGLEVQPENTKLIKKLALRNMNEQRYDDAIAQLNQLLDIEPDNIAGHKNLGIAYYQKKQKSQAMASFQKVAELGGEMNDLYGPMADCYRTLGKRGEAVETIKSGLAVDSQKAWLYSIWGKILEDGKAYDAAIGKFQMAVAQRDEPWSGYARKQITRQEQLKKRAQMIASQGGQP